MPGPRSRQHRPWRHGRSPAPVIVVAGLAALVLLTWPGTDRGAGGPAGQAFGPAPVAAASPDEGPATTPAASAAIGGDTRSAGEGPGLVGSPLLAVGGVLALGLAAAALTLLYVRATGGPGPAR
jgi:hypothetical protein